MSNVKEVVPNSLAMIKTAAALVLLASCSASTPPPPLFVDATLRSGITADVGMTYGAAWGDYDGDGLPDLYVTNHLNDAQLYRNLGTGYFADVTAEVFAKEEIGGDKHGAAWADFDNDGDSDLVQLAGARRGVGTEPKRLFRNSGNHLQDVAKSLGVDNPYGRTRMPLWLDLNLDGRLDLFHGAERRFDSLVPPFVFLQEGDRFEPDNNALPFTTDSVPFCIVTALWEHVYPAVVCRAMSPNQASQCFDTSSLPAKTCNLLPKTAFNDIAAGDFDNDGAIDLFLTRSNPPGTVALGKPGSNVIVADIVVEPGEDSAKASVRVQTAAEVRFEVTSAWPHQALSPQSICLGEQGWHPNALQFSLSVATAGIAGISSAGPGPETQVRIGLIAPTTWQIDVLAAASEQVSSPKKQHQVALKIIGSQPLTNSEIVGHTLPNEAAPARLLMNRDGKLVEASEKRGINDVLVAGVSVVSGDFDNDMDLDLFVLASGLVSNHKNVLLRNRGDGYFEVDPTAGGASGPLAGVGDSVTTVDYNTDGFLDLFVANGGSMGRSLGVPSASGGYRLYRNLGNANHWLQLDLEGTQTNRNGIGARVEVTAGGITQVRFQEGGIHRRSQNHSRLHFGLGTHSQVQSIRIYWPSGTTQILQTIAADQILRITEPST